MAHESPDAAKVVGGGPKSYTGQWYRGTAGLGGATILEYAHSEGQGHYIFDAKGEPRWIFAGHETEPSVVPGVLQLLQFKGFCAVCAPTDVTYHNVGNVTYSFDSETSGSWTLDFHLTSPLVQSIVRTDNVVKLSDTLVCQ